MIERGFEAQDQLQDAGSYEGYVERGGKQLHEQT